MFDVVEDNVSVPMLSLLDAVADAILEMGIETVGLLGTKFTMEKPFSRDALAAKGIKVLVPEKADREYVNRGGERDRILHGLQERLTFDFLLSRAKVEDVAADNDGDEAAAD